MTDQENFETWRTELYERSIRKFPERKPDFITSSEIPLHPIVPPESVHPERFNELGFPGQYPFVRGVQPTMYRGRFWTMRQYAGYSSAEESNARYRFLLEQGQTGLSVAFDLPTQIGYDADDPIALGEVGKVGVSISSIEDMEMLFREIPLDKVSTSMTINAPAAILLAAYIAVAKKQGVDAGKLRGTIQNDILKEYARSEHAPDYGHDAFLPTGSPELEYHQHIGLPYPRSRFYSRAGGGFHTGERHRLHRSCKNSWYGCG